MVPRTGPKGWESITGLLKSFTNTGADSARAHVEKLVVVDVAVVFVNANHIFSSRPVSCFCSRLSAVFVCAGHAVKYPDPALLPSLCAHHEKMVVVDQSAVLFTQGSAASRSSSAHQPMGSPREDGRR